MDMAYWYVLPSVIFCLIFQLLLLPSYSSSSSLPPCNSHDTSALLLFNNSVVVNTSASWCDSSSNKTASWENGTDCCHWDGVTCDSMSGHVIGLDLSCSNLQGQLHPNTTLFHLTHLQNLNLAFNDFSDSLLYPAIGNLVSLTHLNLSYSHFAGEIPSKISHLSKLVSLDLSNSDLTLDASTWNKFILNATNLEELVLNGVNMSSIKEGSLSLLMNLSSLVSLQLSDSGLHGNFPSSLLCFPKIRELDLSFNPMLKVELPKSNWSVPLRVLVLSSISFSGEILDSIGHLKSLQELRLMGCQLKGLLPPSLWNLTQLTDLDLSMNSLNGPIPQSLGNMKSLEWLDLSWNQLGGEIPMSLTNLNFLSVLNLSQNNLEGLIPTGKQFDTFENNSYVGNPLLCGTPLSKSCNLDEEQPTSTSHHEEKFGFGWKPVAVGYACGVLFGMLLGYYCFFLSERPQWLARLVGIPKRSVKRTTNRVNANRRRMN